MFGGKDLTKTPAHKIVEMGMAQTDIKHLDKVMAVRRKMHEPRMCPDRDQLALAEHLGTVHGKILTRGVQILIYLRDSVQDPLFFLCDFS